jgi:hypothetical protein
MPAWQVAGDFPQDETFLSIVRCLSAYHQVAWLRKPRPDQRADIRALAATNLTPQPPLLAGERELEAEPACLPHSGNPLPALAGGGWPKRSDGPGGGGARPMSQYLKWRVNTIWCAITHTTRRSIRRGKRRRSSAGREPANERWNSNTQRHVWCSRPRVPVTALGVKCSNFYARNASTPWGASRMHIWPVFSPFFRHLLCYTGYPVDRSIMMQGRRDG